MLMRLRSNVRRKRFIDLSDLMSWVLCVTSFTAGDRREPSRYPHLRRNDSKSEHYKEASED